MSLSVNKNFLRSAVWLSALTVALPAMALDLQTVMHNMGKIKERHGKFVETKYMTVLNKPLLSSGEVRYVAPNLFEKKTLEPTQDTMRVDGDGLFLEKGGRKFSTKLSSQPQAAVFVNAIAGLLTGDATLLERSYSYELDGTAKKWTLTMMPKDKKMQEMVRKIIASGDEDQVRSIEYQQADGDRSVMVVEPLAEK